MVSQIPVDCSQVDETEWVGFPGGELEGRRPRALCPSCRTAAERRSTARLRLSGANGERETLAAGRALCFQCYRLDLERQRALKAAGGLDTASETRFQSALPFEPVNVARLERLKAERTAARAELRSGVGAFEDRRRRAQIAARAALQRMTAGVERRDAARRVPRDLADHRAFVLAAAAHAAELQLPEAWLPFVVAR